MSRDTEYQRAYSTLNDAQRRAVDQVEGPLLILAGPGTGKTQLLSVRIANILKQTDALPENILCLTFTDAGVNAMKQRLNQIIGKDSGSITVSTYHSFSTDLLSRYPDAFPAYSQLQPAEDMATFEALREAQTQTDHTNLYRSDSVTKNLSSFISDAKRANLTPADLESLLVVNRNAVQQLNGLINGYTKELSRITKQSDLQLAPLLAAAKTLQDPGIYPGECVSIIELFIEELAAATQNDTISKWKQSWLQKQADGSFMLQETTKLLTLKSAIEIYKRYAIQLRENGFYDYDDMLQFAIAGLKHDPDLLSRLQEQYQYILLDEFQDTNAAQAELVAILTNNPILEGRPNVMAVGDDDQAIYEFQGAHYSHMLDFAHRYRQTTIIQLEENYRSTPAILSLATNVAAQIETRAKTIFGLSNQPLTARSTARTESKLERHDFLSSVHEYAWVTAFVADQLKNHPDQSISIIVPKHRYLESLSAFLYAEELPFTYDRQVNIFTNQFVQTCLTMLRLIAALAEADNRHADSLWPVVLADSIWSIDPASLFQLSWHARKEASDWTSVLLGNDKTEPIAKFFLRLCMESLKQPAFTVLEYLIGLKRVQVSPDDESEYTSPYKSLLFDEADGRLQNYESLLTLKRLADYAITYYSEDAPLQLSVAELLQKIDKLLSASITVSAAIPLRSEESRITLQTAYSAKGSEYDTVILLDVNNDVWGDATRNASTTVSLPMNLRYIAHGKASRDERLRLFYVACTRAKTNLILTRPITNARDQDKQPLAYLHEDYAQTPVLSPFLKETTIITHPAAETVLTPTVVSGHWSEYIGSALQKLDVKELVAQRLANYRLSPSDLRSYLDITSAGPESFFITRIIQFPSIDTAHQGYGIAMHKTMEWLYGYYKTEHTIADRKLAVELFKDALSKQPIAVSERTYFESRGIAAIENYLENRQQLFTSDALTEINFRNEKLEANGVPLTGKIDKLLIDKSDELTIVDYKTGKASSAATSSIGYHFNELQLYFYKELVQRSKQFRSKQVRLGCLEYIEPDEQKIIQQKIIKYSEPKTERLLNLLSAIWKAILDGQFSLHNDYPKTLVGIRMFEDDLLDRYADATSIR